MSEGEPTDVTRLLKDWRQGDSAALDQIAPLVEQELRRLARAYLSRERPGHTLQPTALVNEAFVRLIGQRNQVDWQSRSHFIGIAAHSMRQILVDHARKRQASKRGSAQAPLSIDQLPIAAPEPPVDLLALDQALTRLAVMDQRKARVIELRFFGGLGLEEIAEVVGVHLNTVKNDIRMASAWLKTALSGRQAASAAPSI